MTPQDYVTIIAAVAAAICSVIAAFKAGGAHTEAKAARLEATTARAELAAVAKLGPLAAPVPGSLPPGMNITDIFRYSSTIQDILTLLKSIGRVTLGGSVPIPRTVFDLPGGERIELGATTATRLR